MLQSTGFEESGQDEIVLQDGPPAAFDLILQYMYSGRMEFNLRNVKEMIDVFCLAHLYKMDGLVESLVQALEVSICNFENKTISILIVEYNNLIHHCNANPGNVPIKPSLLFRNVCQSRISS